MPTGASLLECHPKPVEDNTPPPELIADAESSQPSSPELPSRWRHQTYFLPYQTAWIHDPSHLRICEKSRQVGMSYADSYDSVRKAAGHRGKDVWVMSRDEVQARQYILYCKRWAKILRYAAEYLGAQLFAAANGNPIRVQVLSFASGANIYALSSNPDAIVGKTGHVKLDEFALHKDQRQLYAVAKPVIQWGGTLSIISTHRGAQTVFNELIRDIKERGNPMGWSLHTIPIHRAVDEGIVEKINAAVRGLQSASTDETPDASSSTDTLRPPVGRAALSSARPEGPRRTALSDGEAPVDIERRPLTPTLSPEGARESGRREEHCGVPRSTPVSRRVGDDAATASAAADPNIAIHLQPSLDAYPLAPSGERVRVRGHRRSNLAGASIHEPAARRVEDNAAPPTAADLGTAVPLVAPQPLAKADPPSTQDQSSDNSDSSSAPLRLCGSKSVSSREEWLTRQRAECIDEEQWLQEYCCVPADESSAFITYEMIAACEDDSALRDWSALEHCPNPLFLGVDVARTTHLSVFDIEEQVGDVLWERMRIELRNKTFAEQEEILWRLLRLPALRRACIDATGLGMQLAERAVDQFGSYKVEPIRFTAQVKEDLAYPLRAAHEDLRLRYKHDDALRADLRGIKKETTTAGHIRFVGESADSHCDRFWSKALALYAARKTQEIGAMIG